MRRSSLSRWCDGRRNLGKGPLLGGHRVFYGILSKGRRRFASTMSVGVVKRYALAFRFTANSLPLSIELLLQTLESITAEHVGQLASGEGKHIFSVCKTSPMSPK